MIHMKLVKKIAAVGASLLIAGSAFAQSGVAPTYRFLPLLNGYNVLVPTNATVGYGSTNVLYTTYAGQVVYSYSNNVNGGLNTNYTAPDAFKVQSLASDANGDINANASLWIYVGNTNWIPVVTTNSVGQWMVPPAGFTNLTLTTAYAGWPLAPASAFPNWMGLATTNYYPAFIASATNVVTVSLFASPTMNPQGGTGSATLGPVAPIWETTASFVTSVTPNGITAVCLSTNLPIAFLQHGRHIYATLSAPPNLASNGNGILVNQLGILQPQN